MADTEKTTKSNSASEFLLLHKLDWKVEGLVAFGFLLLMALLRIKALANIDTHALGGSERDAGLYLWLVRTNIEHLFSLAWFNTEAFYPYTKTLAWSDNFILPAAIVYLLQFTTIKTLTAYNIVLLGTFFLNGYLTYRLAYLLTGRYVPAIGAGICFCAYSNFTHLLGHPQLQFAFFLPLALEIVLRYIANRSLVAALGYGVTVTAAFLTTVYYSIFMVILTGTVLALLVLLRPYHLRWKHFGFLALGAGVGFFPALPFLLPYLDVRSTFGARGIYEAFYFAANGLSYLSAPATNLLYGFTASWSHSEAHLYPGLAVLVCSMGAFLRLCEAKQLRLTGFAVLAAFGATVVFSLDYFEPPRYLCALLSWLTIGLFIWHAYRLTKLEKRLGFFILTNRALTILLLGAALLHFTISLGPLGNPEQGDWALGVYRLFYSFMPGFDSIRAISRIGIVVVLLLILTSAIFLANLETKSRYGMPVALLFAFLALLEHFTPHYPLQRLKPTPAVFDYLHQLEPFNDSVIVLPFSGEVKPNGSPVSWGKLAELHVDAMHWTLPTGWRLVNGYSGQRTKILREFPRKLSGFPDQRSINTLSTISGLRYIIFRSSEIAKFNPDLFLRQTAYFPENLEFVNADAEGNYLFKFKRAIRLDQPHYIQFPSYPAGVAQVEFMTLGQVPDEEVVIDILLKEGDEESLFSAAKVLPNGEWQSFTFALPSNRFGVGPIRLSFKPQSSATVYLQQAKFKPYRREEAAP